MMQSIRLKASLLMGDEPIILAWHLSDAQDEVSNMNSVIPLASSVQLPFPTQRFVVTR